jgi:DNA-binding IclR family transcriptional regulator
MDRGNSVQVLGKATLILDALADEHEVGASRLADLSGEPRSTVYRLLTSLQALDLVEPGSRRAAFRR